MAPNGKEGKHVEYPSRGDQLAQLLECVKEIALPLVHDADDAMNTLVKAGKDGGSSTNLNAIGNFKSHEELREGIPNLPAEGTGIRGFREAVSFLTQHSVNTCSPGFMDKLYSAPSPPGIAAELFLSILNNNSHVWHVSPALSTVEKYVGAQLAQLFGLSGQDAGGITVPGGAAANMLAMLVARNVVAPEIKKQGHTAKQRYAIFVSEAAHYSLANAAQILGLGSEAVIRIPTRGDGTMDVDSLEISIETVLQNGTRPLLIAATAGTTVRGAFDPLVEIGRIARDANAWYHVDACWGGAVAFSDKLKHKLSGAELADSICFNPHKLLGVPLVCSFVLARDLRTFWLANKLEAGYLFHSPDTQMKPSGRVDPLANVMSDASLDVDGDERTQYCREWRKSAALHNSPPASEILDLASLTTQCGRKPDATKFYMHWIYYGTEGMARDVEQAVDSAQYMARLVDSSPHLRLVGGMNVPFTQVCFYWTPRLTSKERSKEDCVITNSQNTQAICRTLVSRGWMIDYAPGSGTDGQYGNFIRVACNRLTSRNVVDALLNNLVEVGIDLDL
ncbi:pyridoxal phosphate-dependent transferase [Camillea tinctor]|nr:pyridoxal phosphate-dependent transferase [Camillea tinctor]